MTFAIVIHGLLNEVGQGQDVDFADRSRNLGNEREFGQVSQSGRSPLGNTGIHSQRCRPCHGELEYLLAITRYHSRRPRPSSSVRVGHRNGHRGVPSVEAEEGCLVMLATDIRPRSGADQRWSCLC